MKVYRLDKENLELGDWSAIFEVLDGDTDLVRHFIKGARKQCRVPASDLDTFLYSLSNKVNNYIEINSSGNIKIY